MHTVFVPYILLDSLSHDPGMGNALAVGHAEHMVMLCVELEHLGEAPEEFLVDAVDITVGGDWWCACMHSLMECKVSQGHFCSVCQ